ncbi:MAG TPA: hypothetical protein VG125_18960 [Pirellulales bacterium]|jgi:hypothetical protein|nr:hypothetical protein [Pirellulales bacterium]
MPQVIEIPPEQTFVERRSYEQSAPPLARERRQFADSYDGLSAGAQELAVAIDSYKLAHRRRFITYEEMLGVVVSLGYHK